MKVTRSLFPLSAFLALVEARIVARQQGSLPVVEVRGNAFFAGDERFYIRGVAYQPGGAADAQDPLLDIPSLRRDVANFKELGINTIRVYIIDNSKDHDEGMRMLDEAGIYLALDANTPAYSINRETAATVHRSYNDIYLQSVFATIDAFAGYNNLLLFFSGNEVIDKRNNTGAAPYVKAVTRDMKTYIANRSPRTIPVGYSAADVAQNVEQQAHFFNCGADDERADFFAFNDYSWCDPSSFTQSGWDQKVRTYADYSVPLFLSEFGCIQNRRDWNEIASLYSENMTGVYSGGLAYEYTVEPNGFGLVTVNANGDVETNDDFERLKTAYAGTSNPAGDGGYKEDDTASECPAASEEWEVESTLLPAMPARAQTFMRDGAGTGPGLEGSGSHFAGEASTATASAGADAPTRTPDGSAAPSGSGNAGANGTGAGVGVGVPKGIMGILVASVMLGMVLMV